MGKRISPGLKPDQRVFPVADEANHNGVSVITINRDIAAGRFPPPDFTINGIRYWNELHKRKTDAEMAEAAR